jgi:phosphoribosylformylglycinamidine (FGAM) synthase-like amidotransferase family enzyme
VKWKYQKGNDTEQRFVDELVKFISEGKIVLGICNGFQLLVKTGLLPGLEGEQSRQSVTLTFNDSGKFEDRWVYVRINRLSNSIFTKGIEKMYLPVRHGEGKLVADSQETLEGVGQQGHIVMQYAYEAGEVTAEYPHNPNGSLESIAALSDPTGRILGMMPHPEAYVHYTQHPRWTRERLREEGDGIKVFQNAFSYVVENQ